MVQFVYMKKSITVFVFGLAVFIPVFAFASTTSGTIDSTNRYAWSENAGWIDFGTTVGAVTVTDSALTGYAYGENIGWISLNCSNTSSCGSNPYAVTNNGNGTLSGYAWSENAGWINFAPAGGGVVINSSGIFTGTAYSENIGWINFTGGHPATTDWRPASSRTSPTPIPTPTPTVSYSSSGGTISVSQLAKILAPSASTTAYINSLINCPTGMVCTPTVGTPSNNSQPSILNSQSFTRTLTIGSTGSDVKALQIYLNTHGFTLSSSGPGSPGNETMRFGLLTKAALKKFQMTHGITPSVGYFGPITMDYIINNP